jgi:hypothetical protein
MYVKKKPLQVPGKGASLHLPQQGLYGERCSVYRANGVLIHLYVGVPKKEPIHEMRRKHSHRQWSPTRTEGIQWGCCLVPEGDL